MAPPIAWLMLLASPLASPTATATVTATATLAAERAPVEAPPRADEDPQAFARALLDHVDVHAFVSQGYFRTTSNQYLSKASTDGSFAFTEVGINFSAQLTERLSTGIQFFGRVLGSGDLHATFDWFYLDYRFTNWLGLRVGRVKLPFGLYNEVSDVDAARVHVLLPQAMYPAQNRRFLLAHTGGELYGRVSLGPVGDLGYRAYGGTVVLENDAAPGPLEITDIRTPYIVGGQLGWDTPIEGLRVLGAIQALRIDFDLLVDTALNAQLQMAGQLPAGFSGRFSAALPAILWVASIEYASGDLVLAAEYGRWLVDLESEQPALLPAISGVQRENFYVLADYRVTSWLQPGAYYAVMFADAAHRGGRAGSTQDVALTLRFDVLPFWLVKLEGHYFNGTALLDSAVNGGKKLTDLDREWFLFLVNTTLYF